MSWKRMLAPASNPPPPPGPPGGGPPKPPRAPACSRPTTSIISSSAIAGLPVVGRTSDRGGVPRGSSGAFGAPPLTPGPPDFQDTACPSLNRPAALRPCGREGHQAVKDAAPPHQ